MSGLHSLGFGEFENGSGRDSFSRLRVSNPTTLFDSQLQYDKQPLIWNEVLTNSGTSTHLPNESSVSMVANADTEKVERQSRTYHRYQPGKSQFILLSFVMDGTTASFVFRSKSTGSVVDTSVAQADWDDPMDGTGPSGVVLDLTKSQILAIDLEWLGVGRVRLCFIIRGSIVPAHEFLFANTDQATAYMTTANLPTRYEVEHTGGSARERVGYFDVSNGFFLQTTGGAGTLKHICTTVISEGGFEEERAFPASVDNKITGTSVATTEVPIISIRPSATFNSVANTSRILMRSIDLLAASQTIKYRVLYNATLTSATFTAVDADYSAVDVDTSASSFTGGSEIDAAILFAGGNLKASDKAIGDLGRLPLGFDIDGSSNPDIITVVGDAAAAGATAFVTMRWREIR